MNVKEWEKERIREAKQKFRIALESLDRVGLAVMPEAFTLVMVGTDYKFVEKPEGT